ncbi:MAG: YqjF family protein [Parachlamydiaceae bacterium]
MRSRPKQAAIMRQCWRDLLFVHWDFPKELVQKTLPKGLFVDTFNDKAYVGIVPFFLKNLRLEYLPRIPFLKDFNEVNLRTYVYDESGTPGVYFYSLDINSILAVIGARAFFSLAYFYSSVAGEKRDGVVQFRLKRQGETAEYIYRPNDQGAFEATPLSLEFFLVERYALFTEAKNKLYQGRVHHEPYRLAQVEVLQVGTRLFAWDHLTPPKEPPAHIIYSKGVDVEIFRPTKCSK